MSSKIKILLIYAWHNILLFLVEKLTALTTALNIAIGKHCRHYEMASMNDVHTFDVDAVVDQLATTIELIT